MIKNIISLSFCLLLLFFFPRLAFAHILVSDKNIGAVLHIDPEDDPIIGQPTNFFFEFKDKEHKFTPANCDCTVFILEAGKIIATQPLFQNNTSSQLTTATLTYTFPQKDVYTIRVIGKPAYQNAFQPFTLEYAVRVTRENVSSPVNAKQDFLSHVIHYAPIEIGAVIILLIVIQTRRKQQQKI